ncbi:MAG: hypothetical protein HRU82_13740 [Nitrospira sp.]|nr:MAG: hypothetical protein HRU82_13740 [Nitrospira sp.]
MNPFFHLFRIEDAAKLDSCVIFPGSTDDGPDPHRRNTTALPMPGTFLYSLLL